MPIFSLAINPPQSILPYPQGIWPRAKYIFWRAITPPFPHVRDALLAVGILSHVGRQNFRLGKLESPAQLQPFLDHLHTFGFGNHFIAWHDDGEVVGVRRLDGFDHQYHLRVFEDGEVYAHYEFTPESHPIWHMKEVDIEERREEFLTWIGGWVR